jgi:hypothetical protein
MTRTLPFEALLVLVIGGHVAHAGVDYDANPVVKWEDEKGPLRGFFSQCTALKEGIHGAADKGLGTVVCRFDEKSFNDHYAKEKKDKADNARDNSSPTNHCGYAIGQLNGSGGSGGSGFLADQYIRAPKPSAAFRAKVKTITCIYDDNPKTSPSLTLVKNELVIRCGKKQPDGDSRCNESGWIVKGLATAFPEFKAEWNDKHPNDKL